MRNLFKLIQKKNFIALSALAVSLIAGTVMLSAPKAAAAPCPQDNFPETNIMYCGLPSSSSDTGAAPDLAALKQAYISNTDHNGNDITKVYTAANLTLAKLNDTKNWAIALSSPDGRIVINGKVVASNVQIGSRCVGANGPDLTQANKNGYCNPASRYKYLTSNVFTRDATWFFDTGNISKVTLVHLDSHGNADFAAWVQCGNLLIIPRPIPPVSSLKCTNLDVKPIGDSVTNYALTVTANVTNTPNVTVDLNITGNGIDHQEQKFTSVKNGVLTVEFIKIFDSADAGITFQAQALVNNQAPSASCHKEIPIPVLVCHDLAASHDGFVYTFTVNVTNPASQSVSYAIVYSDTGTQPDTRPTKSSPTQATFVHTYTQLAKTQVFTVKATINKQSQVPLCEGSVTIPGTHSLACVSLKATPGENGVFNFVATAEANNTSITTYTFDFGDGTTSTITSSDTQVTTSHKYDSNITNGKASFTVNGPQGSDTSNACETTFSHILPHTGASGMFGLAALASVTGTALYQVVLRRRG